MSKDFFRYVCNDTAKLISFLCEYGLSSVYHTRRQKFQKYVTGVVLNSYMFLRLISKISIRVDISRVRRTTPNLANQFGDTIHNVWTSLNRAETETENRTKTKHLVEEKLRDGLSSIKLTSTSSLGSTDENICRRGC